MSYKPVDPQSISDAYQKMNRTEAEAEAWKRQTCEVLGKSEAFRAVLLAVQVWSEQQMASGVSPKDAGVALLAGIMASGFQLGILVGGRDTMVGCAQIALSEYRLVCRELADFDKPCCRATHTITSQHLLTIEDQIKKEFDL